MHRAEPDDRFLGRHGRSEAEIGDNLCCSSRILGDPDRIAAVRDPFEQEETVEVGARGVDDFARAVDELEVEAFESDPPALNDGAFDVAAADKADFDFGRNAGPRYDHLEG